MVRVGARLHVFAVRLIALVILTGAAHAGLGQSLWDTFSNNYTANCLAWTHHRDNPVVSPSGSTWKSRWTANPEILQLGKRMLLYYRGNGVIPGEATGFHDRIGVAELGTIGPERLGFRDLNNGSPVVNIGKDGAFDAENVLDPAAVEFKGEVLLYYSAIGKGPNSIGLAVSADGERFNKVGKVLEGRSPDAVVSGDTLFLCYQRHTGDGYKVYLAYSLDGRSFSPVGSAPVFASQEKRWDAKSITTPRIFKEGEWYYMMYGGSADFVDEPEYFGLARSRDLRSWERHPGNPVFSAGAHATADGGAIWFPAVIDVGIYTVMLYEGSRGRYSWDIQSSICMAWIAKR
jgi:predicted GH43/DUF377 family glycosyl hydrolase